VTSVIGLGPEPVQVVAWEGPVTGSSPLFGTAPNNAIANSGTGDSLDFAPTNGTVGILFVPVDYVSGAPLSGTATWSNTTIAALDLIPGSYTYNWGTGPDADFFTVNIGPVTPSAPEPASALLLASGAALLFHLRKKQRRA
jgi:hypothetical protein